MNRIKTIFLLIALMVSGTLMHAQSFTNYTSADGLPSDNVTGVAIDAANQKWFGTQEGVARYDDVTWTVFTTENGLIDNYINCIAVDVGGNIWAGTDFGVSRYDGAGWTSFTTAAGLIDNMVICIAGDPDGSVWFGTGSGLSNFNGSAWHNYTTADGLPNNLISCIAVDQDGDRWFGTFIGGLSKFDGATFTNFTMADSLPSDNIISAGIGAGKTTWIGTYNGVAVFDSLDRWIETYRAADGLYNDFVQDIAMDSRNTMWFALYDIYKQEGGITRNNQSVWKSYSVADGLIHHLVKKVAVDQADNVWIATGGGVSRLHDPNSAISELSRASLRPYPNPATTELHVDGVTTAGNFEIITLSGSTVVSQRLATGSNRISLQSLAPGLYIMKYTTGSSAYSGKLIIR